jgi:hypothetical protein
MAVFPLRELVYRCAGPHCGRSKGNSERWWLMWTAQDARGVPVLHLCEWNETIAQQEGALHVCGEGCAQKLQSMFLANIRENRDRERQVQAVKARA